MDFDFQQTISDHVFDEVIFDAVIRLLTQWWNCIFDGVSFYEVTSCPDLFVYSDYSEIF